MSNKIKSFVEFWQEIKKIKPYENEIIIFRGHSDYTWKLEPGIFRSNKVDDELNQYHDIMLEYPEEFRQRSHLSNLVKMQHYGVSTRLLDFTRNPLIALFFASETKSSNVRDGEVICIKVKKSDILHHNSDRALMLSCLPCFTDKQHDEMQEFCNAHKGRIKEQFIKPYGTMHKFLHEIRGEYPGFECEIIGEDLLKGYFVAPFKDNIRMKLQNGLFYIFGLDKNSLCNRFEINRILIDKNHKNEILDDLELLNISSARIYYGLENMAMEKKDKSNDWQSNRKF